MVAGENQRGQGIGAQRSPIRHTSVPRILALSATSLGLMLVYSCLTFIPQNSFATDENAEIGVRLGTVISISVDPTDFQLVVANPTATDTVVKDDIAIDVNTNNPTGYYLTMRATLPANVNLVHTGSPQTNIPTISAPTSNLSGNTWGYGLGSNATNFLAIPSTDSTLKNTSDSSDSRTIITVGAGVNIGAMAGIYASSLTFTATTNYVPGPSIFSMSGVMRGGNTLTIIGENFFAGGNASAISSITVGGSPCFITGITTDSQAACTLPTNLEGGQRLVVLTTSDGSTSRNINYISDTDFAKNTCDNMAAFDTATITDNRNDQTYSIRKMRDGKCWMISNLKFNPSDLNNNIIGNAAGTYNLISASHGDGYMTAQGTDSANSANIDVAFYYDYPSDSDDYDSSTFYGYLYNWYAATAGTGLYAMIDEDATSSICPSPFYLPSADGGDATLSNEFADLNGKMPGNGPPSLNGGTAYAVYWANPEHWRGVYSDSWWRGSIMNPGVSGYYWSSSAGNMIGFARVLWYTGPQGGNFVYPGNTMTNEYAGQAIRCVLNPS